VLKKLILLVLYQGTTSVVPMTPLHDWRFSLWNFAPSLQTV
jgi:hypothetical protein